MTSTDSVVHGVLDAAQAALDAYLRAQAVSHELYEQKGPDDPAYSEAADKTNIADYQARGLALAVFRCSAITVEGVIAKLKFYERLERDVDESDLDTWWHVDEWRGCVLHDLEEIKGPELRAA